MAAKKGERRLQILQEVAHMLENPKGEKITTAALAARLDVSEAALYRHFASKAQIYEGLIAFIEETVFGLINKITIDEESGLAQARAIVAMLLGFAEKNPGMVRVLIGDALINEDERLQVRINALYDRLEATLKQCLRVAVAQALPQPAENTGADGGDAAARANAMLCYVIGRWHQYARSGFKRMPGELLEKQWALFAGPGASGGS